MHQILYSVIISVLIGGTAGYLGSLMITKRTALIGDAFGHVALPGIALALVNGFDPSVGAMIALSIGIIMIWLFELRSKLAIEALTGIVFTASVAIAFLFIPKEQVITALIGDISSVDLFGVVISLGVCLAILLVLRQIYPKILLMNMSELIAKTEHVNVDLINLIFLACVGLIVALGIKVTGSLLIGALVITPAATSRNIARNLSQYRLGSFLFGAMFCLVGLAIYHFTGWPAGPMTILTASVIFVLSLIARKK